MKIGIFLAVLLTVLSSSQCNFDDMFGAMMQEQTAPLSQKAIISFPKRERIFKKVFYGTTADEDLITSRYYHACVAFLQPKSSSGANIDQIEAKRTAICNISTQNIGTEVKNRFLADRMIFVPIEQAMKTKFVVSADVHVQASTLKKDLLSSIKKLRKACSDPDYFGCRPEDSLANTETYRKDYKPIFDNGLGELKTSLRETGLKLLI